MKFQEEIPYITPKTKEFIEDMLLHSVCFKIDRMHDNSWRRINSNLPLEWIYNNINKITLSTLNVVTHSYEDMNEKWNAPKHLELSIELREVTTTYILSMEINFQYLDYFVEKYSLSKN